MAKKVLKKVSKKVVRKVAKIKAKKALGSVIKKAAPTFKVEIESSGVHFKAKGNDLHELLRQFPAPALFKTETNILVTKGKKTVQKDLKVAEARRCFTGFDTTSLELLAIGLTKRFA